jgi:PPOX class probable F420-dependent enzyme
MPLAAGASPTNPALELLGRRKTVVLTTYRRNGTAVATPVSITATGDRAFFRTWDTAWKAKRLRRNPNVEVAAPVLQGLVVPFVHRVMHRRTLVPGRNGHHALKPPGTR